LGRRLVDRICCHGAASGVFVGSVSSSTRVGLLSSMLLALRLALCSPVLSPGVPGSWCCVEISTGLVSGLARVVECSRRSLSVARAKKRRAVDRCRELGGTPFKALSVRAEGHGSKDDLVPVLDMMVSGIFLFFWTGRPLEAHVPLATRVVTKWVRGKGGVGVWDMPER
jgi:hypothetical protein